MFRNALAVLLLVLGVGVALHAVPETGLQQGSMLAVADNAPDDPAQRWTAERIARDIVGRSVDITDVDERLPLSPWTFDEEEPRNVEVQDSQVTGTVAVITIYLATHDNQDVGEETTYVSGRLRLRYEREGDRWQLRAIENLSFRASQGGIST